ncbi:MAG: serine/threonine protein kinase [Labilithrix sp.]|nr:serine/threonine protein kinase [Labilithrix sp.]
MSESDDLAVAEARVGQVLGDKYRIERVLGIGGMAAVYAATHRNGRRVALKLLHPELNARPDLRKRFLREAQAANAVNHPGVVAVIDDDVSDDGVAYLVMELLDGRTVEELAAAEGGKLSIKATLSIAADLCAVLAVAHGLGVVHRDLKPANLFVTTDGALKVLDFGIARVRDEAGPRATQTGAVMGTPAFMAPEQAAGLVKDVGPPADIWAVGATIFNLLTGHAVHEGQSAQHLAILAATTPARSLATVLPDAPTELIALVDRALAFDQGSRWESAAALRAAIDEIVATLTESATPIGAGLSETMLAAAKVAVPGSTLASRGNRHPPVLGKTTSEPVSSTAETRIRHPRSRTVHVVRRRWLALSIAAIALVVAVGMSARPRRPGAEEGQRSSTPTLNEAGFAGSSAGVVTS